MSDPGARTSDPQGSHEAVAAIREWHGLVNAILQVARAYDPIPFDDGDLTASINNMWDHPVQRNVVARSRGIIERQGSLVRIGNRTRDGKTTMHFRLPDEQTRAADPAPEVKDGRARTRYTLVEGTTWCTTHNQVWFDGDPWCWEQFGITRFWPPAEGDFCNMVSLFHEQE